MTESTGELLDRAFRQMIREEMEPRLAESEERLYKRIKENALGDLDGLKAEFGEFRRILTDVQSTQGTMLRLQDTTTRLLAKSMGIEPVELGGTAEIDLDTL